MAARMVPDKLHNLFIEIFLNNKLFLLDNNIQVLFAGDGILIDSLKKKVHQHKLQNFIIFSGTLEEKKLIKWFKKLDLYVHLSKDETTSTSILQAMSMSLPIIASNIGGNRNLVRFTKSTRNIILADNNIKDVYKKIKYVLMNKEIKKKMSKFARKTVERYYSCERMYKNYQKLF